MGEIRWCNTLFLGRGERERTKPRGVTERGHVRVKSDSAGDEVLRVKIVVFCGVITVFVGGRFVCLSLFRNHKMYEHHIVKRESVWVYGENDSKIYQFLAFSSPVAALSPFTGGDDNGVKSSWNNGFLISISPVGAKPGHS